MRDIAGLGTEDAGLGTVYNLKRVDTAGFEDDDGRQSWDETVRWNLELLPSRVLRTLQVGIDLVVRIRLHFRGKGLEDF